MTSDPKGPEVSLGVHIPAPFNSGTIIMSRGEWIQCEVRRREPRELREMRARRIYLNDEGFSEALFQLLTDLAEPSNLPVWERGESIAGYRTDEAPQP